MSPEPARTRARRGVAMIVALVMTTILVCLATALISVSMLELRKGGNLQQITRAQLAAESGLAYTLRALRDVRLPSETPPEALAAGLYAALSAKLSPPPVLSASAGGMATLTVPAVDLSPGSFTCTLTLDPGPVPPVCRLRVEGTSGDVSRWVATQLLFVRKRSVIFNHGIASRGKIVIQGSAHVEGVTHPSDASILSTCDEPVAIEAGGHATVDGDLYITGDSVSAIVLTGGGLSIGGASDIDEIFDHHVHMGTTDPQFPPTDTSAFAALATNVIDGNTDLSGTTSFSNIRIKAGTDPVFSSNTVLSGVVYVEAPNKVQFSGQVTIKGVLATQDGSGHPLGDCQLTFTGNVSAPGVSALSDAPEYTEVKKLTGTVVLAPGFATSFKGSSNGFNGVVAADQVSFLGSSGILGEVTGTIVGLKNKDMILSGNASIRIRGSSDSTPPTGFIQPWGLDLVPGSYTEPIAGQE
ncbi:MAG TPA: pilus assembly PilX N-terminal domain-containing protein [Phycisphaerae bacterium]|nr:pilus assembly PilX N-terminal domain-containing protein [Phycisphaerae bacterium]